MSISDYGAQFQEKDIDGIFKPIYPITKVEYILGNVVQSVNGSAPNDNGDVQIDIPTTLPANGGNAATVNGFTVNANVPANAVFTDTKYTLPVATNNYLGGIIIGTTLTISGDGTVNITAKNVEDALGYKPVSGTDLETIISTVDGVKLIDDGNGGIEIVSKTGKKVTIEEKV